MNKMACYATIIFSTLALMTSFGNATEINPERPTVTKAFDVFEKYPETIPQGTLIAFKKKNTQIAKHIMESGVQARVFALNDQEHYPTPIDIKDNCNHYISKVIPLYTGNDNLIIFGKVEEAWLNITRSGKSAKDGRYYLVFEKSGPKQEHFRLKTSDVPAYFDSGFLLTIKGNETVNIDKVRTEYEKRENNLEKLVIDGVSNNIPCYRYSRFAEIKEIQEYSGELLALCEDEKTIIDLNKNAL